MHSFVCQKDVCGWWKFNKHNNLLCHIQCQKIQGSDRCCWLIWKARPCLYRTILTIKFNSQINQYFLAATHLVPNPFDPRTSSPPLPVPWTNDPDKVDPPPGQMVPIKFGPHGQMVPKYLVPQDKWSPTNLVPKMTPKVGLKSKVFLLS